MKREFFIAAIVLLFSLFTSQRSSAQLDNLIIQEYVDWNGGDGLGIKIYNPTPTPINLSGYRIAVYNNGNTSANSTGNLTGTINPGENFITGNSGYCFTNCASSCDQSLSITGVNDGDVVRLEQNGIAVDAIGCVGYSGNFTLNGNLVTNALRWVKLIRESDNCTRYSENDGVSPNSWPNSTAINFEGWEVQIPSCLSTAPWNYTPEETVTTVSICPTDSIEINGSWISESGTYSLTLQNEVLCDSIVSTIVVVLPNYYDTQSISICEGETAFLEGAFQSTTGVYFDTLTTITGCDSIIETTLQVLAAPNNSTNVEICHGDSLLVEGTWIKTPGTYTHDVNIGDCTFSENFELTFSPAPTDQFFNISGCENAEYNGVTYTSNAQFVDTLTSINGCDSAYLHVAIVVNTIEIAIEPVDPVCAETPFEINASANASLNWDNNSVGPIGHYTLNTSRYVVVSGSDGACMALDSIFVQVLGSPQLSGPLQYTTCFETPFITNLTIDTNAEILWAPTQYLSADNIANPIITAGENMTYTVTIGNTCDTISEVVSVQVLPAPNPGINSGSFSICEGDSLHLNIANNPNQDITISPATQSLFEDDGITLFPSSTTTFAVSAQNTCGSAAVNIDVSVLKFPVLPESAATKICAGTPFTYTYSPEAATEYQWNPEIGILNDLGSAILNPEQNTVYTLEATNSCGTSTTHFQVDVDRLQLDISADTTICAGDMAILHASGAETYEWSPAQWIDSPNEAVTLAFPQTDTHFEVFATKGMCQATRSMSVYLSTAPPISQNTIEILPGESIDLTHYFDDYQIISPVETEYTIHSDTTLNVSITDSNGCRFQNKIHVEINPTFYAPNAFTPDGDGLNDIWKVISPSVEKIEIQVFDRWGGLVFKTNDIKQGWNGDNTFSEGDYFCSPDIYNYVINVQMPNRKAFTTTGHITLIR